MLGRAIIAGTEVILGDDEHWSAPGRPSLENYLNAAYPVEGDADQFGPIWRQVLDRAVRDLGGQILERPRCRPGSRGFTDMSDPAAQALLAAVLARPDDDTPRLVYADWLEEQGDGTRAEFIRLQVELQVRCGDESPPTLQTPRDLGLYARSRELFNAHAHEWVEHFAWVNKDGSVTAHPPGATAASVHGAAYRFRRGFVEEASMAPASWLAWGDRLLTEYPLRLVYLTSQWTDDSWRHLARRWKRKTHRAWRQAPGSALPRCAAIWRGVRFETVLRQHPGFPVPTTGPVDVSYPTRDVRRLPVDAVAARLLVRVRQGHVEVVGVLADHLEEQGDPRVPHLRQLLATHAEMLAESDARDWSHVSHWTHWEDIAYKHGWLRFRVGAAFGRYWKNMELADLARVTGVLPRQEGGAS
jgi:uncharacterized protein (TIGR02996 family)